MNALFRSVLVTAFVAMSAVASTARAQVAVTANPKHDAMLASSDPKLAANKKLVYDFWREVFEGGHMERVDAYMAESYIQHNPMVPTGRAAFVDFFSKRAKPQPVEPRIKGPLVAMIARTLKASLAEAKWRSAISASGATDCTWRGHSGSLSPWKAPGATPRMEYDAAFIVFRYMRSSNVSTPEVRFDRMLSR